jgi:hypothetical protein
VNVDAVIAFVFRLMERRFRVFLCFETQDGTGPVDASAYPGANT